MKRGLFFFLFTFSLRLLAQNTNLLEQRLFDLPDVSFKKIDAPAGFESAYQLKIRQPIDHKHPEKGYFYQKAFLSHKGIDRPMLLGTEGYACPENRYYRELDTLLSANQIVVEYRYFGESQPQPYNFEYCTVEQASNDYHHIREIFGKLYNQKWVSTGVSRGGQTAIFYRYFFPDDVAVSVPYVAPMILELEDKRIYRFLDTVGTPECRSKIKAFQIRLLKERERVLPMLYWYAKGAKLDFTYLNLGEAFEYAILEYPFSFWQVTEQDCAKIPDQSIPLDSAVAYLIDLGFGVDYFSDKEIKSYAPHMYTAGMEIGYYGYQTEDFKGLLKSLPMLPHPSAIYMPDKMATKFDPTLTQNVSNWLKTNGNRFVYIYGSTDTWTAAGVPYSDGVDALWFILQGKNHYDARIRNFNPAEKQKLVTTLERWLDIKIKH